MAVTPVPGDSVTPGVRLRSLFPALHANNFVNHLDKPNAADLGITMHDQESEGI